MDENRKGKMNCARVSDRTLFVACVLLAFAFCNLLRVPHVEYVIEKHCQFLLNWLFIENREVCGAFKKYTFVISTRVSCQLDSIEWGQKPFRKFMRIHRIAFSLLFFLSLERKKATLFPIDTLSWSMNQWKILQTGWQPTNRVCNVFYITCLLCTQNTNTYHFIKLWVRSSHCSNSLFIGCVAIVSARLEFNNEINDPIFRCFFFVYMSVAK